MEDDPFKYDLAHKFINRFSEGTARKIVSDLANDGVILGRPTYLLACEVEGKLESIKESHPHVYMIGDRYIHKFQKAFDFLYNISVRTDKPSSIIPAGLLDELVNFYTNKYNTMEIPEEGLCLEDTHDIYQLIDSRKELLRAIGQMKHINDMIKNIH